MRYQRLWLSVFPVLLVGFFLFSLPNVASAQVLGCCINNSGNCVQCGPQGSSCQTTQTGACSNPPGSNGLFVPGAFCFQVTNTQGECQVEGCCQIAQGDCFQTTSGTCTTGGNTFLGDGACQPQFDAECSPLGCCQTPGVNPTSCNTGVTQLACENGGGAFTLGVSCDGNFCGQAPPPTGCCQGETGQPPCQEDITQAACGDGDWEQGNIMCSGDVCGEPPIGCCQIEAGVCNDVTEDNCQGTFFEGGMCPESGFCEPPPQGCCVCSNDVTECTFTTEFECENMECEYQGDNVPCSAVEECDVPPEGCCVLPENGGIVLASLLDEIKDNCVVETESACQNQGGAYQGDGVSCDTVPECQIAPIADIPTIGQWGMIAMAGLLGIFSLFIIMRRHRYNVG